MHVTDILSNKKSILNERIVRRWQILFRDFLTFRITKRDYFAESRTLKKCNNIIYSTFHHTNQELMFKFDKEIINILIYPSRYRIKV